MTTNTNRTPGACWLLMTLGLSTLGCSTTTLQPEAPEPHMLPVEAMAADLSFFSTTHPVGDVDSLRAWTTAVELVTFADSFAFQRLAVPASIIGAAARSRSTTESKPLRWRWAFQTSVAGRGYSGDLIATPNGNVYTWEARATVLGAQPPIAGALVFLGGADLYGSGGFATVYDVVARSSAPVGRVQWYDLVNTGYRGFIVARNGDELGYRTYYGQPSISYDPNDANRGFELSWSPELGTGGYTRPGEQRCWDARQHDSPC